MRKAWSSLLVVSCLLSFVLLLGFFNASKPRILVLHSGSEESPWSREVDRGMRETLTGNRRPVSVEWMYMDVAAPGSGRAAGPARAEARRAISRDDPTIVIAVDDDANQLVAREYVGKQSPRILYVSLDRPPADYGYAGAPNVSGIAERLPFAGVKDAITAMFPGRIPTVSAIGVDGFTGRAEMEQFDAFDWGTMKVQSRQLVSSGAGWRDFVSSTDSDVLVVLSCQDLPDGGGAVFSAADAARWARDNAKALPIGTQVDFVANGGALSFSPDPDEYGARAIRLALDWLDDRSTPGPPAAVESSAFEVAIRQDALATRGLTLAPIYLQAARENGTLFG